MSIDRSRKQLVLRDPAEVLPAELALSRVTAAFRRWQPQTEAEARRVFDALAKTHPDHHAPEDFWTSASSKTFREFFVWGHDHDFGFGQTRRGAMGSRHVEITSELLSLGMLPQELAGQKVLDVGCWTGGDLLILAGMGASVEAIEEHPLAAAAAADLCRLLSCDAPVHCVSLYQDKPEWRQRFDVVYCSGVIYHVTDPLLLLRICFAYLKPGGRVIIETKMQEGTGSTCSYSGIAEKGWNWYAPTYEAMGRWLVDAGFAEDQVCVHRRPIGRLLASAIKAEPRGLPETAGFSRPGSWLEGVV
jgi:2-polyprenyl-3-methyl-5-hydroxy-6-metoxy-1,4-benzoquinol methylase